MEVSQKLSTTLFELEEERLSNISKIKKGLGIIFLLTGSVAVYCYLSESVFSLIVTLVVGAMCGYGLTSYLLGKVKKAFKNQVIPVLVSEIDPSLEYHCAKYIHRDEFNNSGLYRQPDRYTGKDWVGGFVGDTEVRFSLVHAEEEYEETTTDSDGDRHTQTHYRTIFRGLFFVADFNKHFSGRTLVRPGSANFISKLFGSHVALEDVEFNKQFKVASTDQVEARYILTPSLMERLKQLNKKFGKFQASFCGGQVYMAIDFPFDAFEPTVTKPFTDESQVG